MAATSMRSAAGMRAKELKRALVWHHGVRPTTSAESSGHNLTDVLCSLHQRESLLFIVDKNDSAPLGTRASRMPPTGASKFFISTAP